MIAMDDFERTRISYADGVLTLPKGAFKRAKELYISVAGRALYIKTEKQFSHFMNGAKRLGYDKVANFYRECMNNSYVLDYIDNRLELSPEIERVLDENEPTDMIMYFDDSGAVVAKASFFDEKLNKTE